MKLLKSKIISFIIILLFSSCELFIIHQPEPDIQPPELPPAETFTIPLNKFDTIFGDETHYNYDIAAKMAISWKDYISVFQRLFDFYSICQQSNGQHFGGDTWYWQVFFRDSVFELYATSFSDNEILIEAYINPRVDQGNSDSTNKVLEGYYFPGKQSGNFSFISKEKQLTINWANNHIVYFWYDNTANSGKNLLFKTQQNIYLYNFIRNQNTDTIYVHQSINENWGKIKNYNIFSDYNWHCWDNELQNTDCDD